MEAGVQTATRAECVAAAENLDFHPRALLRTYPGRRRDGRPYLFSRMEGGQMAKQAAITDDGFRLSDELWGQMEPLLPARPAHPLGCHRPRTPDRTAMDAIFFVLRTGCQW